MPDSKMVGVRLTSIEQLLFPADPLEHGVHVPTSPSVQSHDEKTCWS